MTQRGCVGALVLLLLGLAANRARAAPLNVTLEYSAVPGCPDAAGLEAVVVARLGENPFVESPADQLLVRIARRDGSLEGRLEWRDAAGKWAGDQAFSMAGDDCPGLVQTMGFAIAVQLQMLATTRAPPDNKVRVPVQTAPSTPVPSAPPAPKPGPAFAIGAGPSVGFGMSSKPILLGRLFGALAWQRFSFELSALASVSSTTRRADGAGFSQQHLLVSGVPCAVRSRWNACLVANAGQIRMLGDAIDRPTSAWVPLLQVGARAGFVQPLGGKMFLSAHADGLINLIRWTGSLDDIPVWTAPRFAAAVAVDAGVRFH